MRHDINDYVEQLRKNELRVKFKNAIMQKWTKVKQENAPADISALVDQMLRKKRAAQNDPNNQSKARDAEDQEEKIQRRRERAA